MGNGVTIKHNYNARQSITSLAYANSSGKKLWSKSFEWNKNASNLMLLTDVVSGYGRQFTYDTLNRVITAKDIAINVPGDAIRLAPSRFQVVIQFRSTLTVMAGSLPAQRYITLAQCLLLLTA